MYIFIYYSLTILYGYLFTVLFGVDFTNYSNPFTYILSIAALIIGLLLSFVTIVLSLAVISRFREHKEYDNKFNHRLINSVLEFALHLFRVKLTVTGRENIPKDTNFVLVGNHQENWDIVVLKVIFKDKILNFIAKEALSHVPILGRWITLLGNVFISREADRSAAESIVKGIKQVRKGTNMGVFPEGKRSFGNELVDFKAGSFKLAMKPKADLLIATQYNTCTIFKKIPWKRYHVYVHILPLFTYEEYQGMKSHEISDIVKSRIQNQLDIFKETVK
jgi:1-acyl-sn-glycerol-3-phosphate acyltransferase